MPGLRRYYPVQMEGKCTSCLVYRPFQTLVAATATRQHQDVVGRAVADQALLLATIAKSVFFLTVGLCRRALWLESQLLSR